MLTLMFEISGWNWPVSRDLSSLFARTFDDIASAGNGWYGVERVAIAELARNGAGRGVVNDLPDAAVNAATMIANQPAGSQESQVRETVRVIGETRYVELVGIVVAMTAIDTITTLLGFGTETLPEPHAGEPILSPTDPKLKRRSAWVAMTGPARPRYALSAAPMAQAMVTRLLDRLYMTSNDLGGTSLIRGLTREQMEIVILKVSHSNECFW